MKLITFDEFSQELPLADTRSAVTVGVFDGVHQGQQLLIDSIVSREHAASVLITFKQNPKAMLHHEQFLGHITTFPQKLRILSEYCIDYLVIIDFTEAFSMLTGMEFFTMVAASCSLEYLVIGENFHCGSQGKFSSRNTRDFFTPSQIHVDIIPSLLYDGIHTVSSTAVRKAVTMGDFSLAGKLMGRPFALDLAELPFSRSDGMVRIDIEDITQPLPPPGEYRVVSVPQGTERRSAVSIAVTGRDVCVPDGSEKTELVFES